MKFVDIAKFTIKAGNGGNGAVSFRRELYVPNGGPNGGDGGKGGDIIFIANEGKTSLLDLKERKVYEAEHGENGANKNMHGAFGKNLVIEIPVGTILYDVKTNKVLADFTKDGQRETIAKGGKGGRGNARFATSRNKAPTIFENGDLGQKYDIKAELKVVADVGFVGLPNAGKSTMLRSISNSRPVIADYPFTTINPQLGVSIDNQGRTFVVADLPGLIEGASQGKGLGIQFLRHVERCRIICHIIDMTGNYGTEDVVKNYEIIRKELESYKLDLTRLPEIIVANKVDSEYASENLKIFKSKFKKTKIIETSGLKKINLDKLLLAIGDALEVYKNNISLEKNPIEEYKEYKFFDSANDIKVMNLGNGKWEISGETIYNIFHKTPISTYDNLLLFNEKIKNTGAYEILRKKGAKKGDIVKIFDTELEWMD
ncbi:GTPase ObgE [Spiroplasma endosymbiont of Crioceris asparagi]|uniref:GTPase ObgE n=1 Tax=Spiroplasma endosymbiont of Crioceris asparagi TaxID=3066286 RepID=UPI0030D3E322